MTLAAGLVGCVLGSEPALAGPRGEQRALGRDADRAYTVVAGDGDASATVQNPANLGYLEGLGGVIDFSFNTRASGLRGSGVGAFVGLPLPFDILSLGIGVQQMFRRERGGDDALALDAPHGKFTFAMAFPLSRWGVRGLSLGLGASALYSANNVLLRGGVSLVDVGLSWRANRFVSMGLTLRGVNQPRIQLPQVLGSGTTSVILPGGESIEIPSTEIIREEIDGRLGMVLDPEIALRPSGRSWFEVAVGMRISPYPNGSLPPQVNPGFVLQPRARLLAGYGGFRGYVEGERIGVQRFDSSGVESGLRFMAGLQVDAEHWGVAGGANFAAGTEPASGVVGGHGRIRISADAYRDSARARPRKVTRFDLGDYRGERGTARLVAAIDDLARRRAATMLLDLRSAGMTYAQIEEVREAVLRFRSTGGQVVAYVQGPNTRNYFLAAAADRIWAHPTHELAILGVRLRSFYYGEILSRLGVASDFVRIAEYKGAAEIYANEHASAPVAAQRDQLLMDAWNHVVRSVARDRGHQAREVAGWIDTAPLTPERAERMGAIDGTAWPDELDEKLEAWLRKPVRIEKPDAGPRHADNWGPPAHVAVLFVEGDLVTGKSAYIPFLGRKLAGSDTLTAQIRKLRKDPTVKAVVVRIASRGGSVSSAEAIARELDLTAKEKPVLVSMGSVAASGGYYIATAGSYIFADATTTTGSIGIFYPKMDLSGLLERFGVGMDLVGYGAHANMRSWFKAYTPEERAAAQASIQFSYDQFTKRVAEARSMSPEQVDAVARGRVWSGVRAIDVGLVDAYGGLREALVRTKEIAGLPETTPQRAYPPTPGLIDQIRSLFGLQIPRILAGPSIDEGFAEGGSGVKLGARARKRAGAPGALMPRVEASGWARILADLPASLWTLESPEAMALDTWHHELE